jgi:streptomycin 6-kinase
MSTDSGFDPAPWLARWGLTADGPPVETAGALLWPVIAAGRPAMLKLTADPGEIRGMAVLEAWRGQGAVAVLARDGGALLMPRAEGQRSLIRMAQGGEDGAATRVLCATARRLHGNGAFSAHAVPLSHWLADLRAAAGQGGILALAAGRADALIAADPVLLHGDLHHGNVLDFGPHGWLAIDPKGVIGPAVFDLAPLFSNPDLADPGTAVARDRFAARLGIVLAETGIDRAAVLDAVLVQAALSAVWFLADGDDRAAVPLRIAELADGLAGRR